MGRQTRIRGCCHLHHSKEEKFRGGCSRLAQNWRADRPIRRPMTASQGSETIKGHHMIDLNPNAYFFPDLVVVVAGHMRQQAEAVVEP